MPSVLAAVLAAFVAFVTPLAAQRPGRIGAYVPPTVHPQRPRVGDTVTFTVRYHRTALFAVAAAQRLGAIGGDEGRAALGQR
ncbi:MAG TPA: hypothetical protein VM033_05630 [Gemmatimonadaceae bacterium]|nr:hypothetical protein [Gemmatimonadaceae bacterium]